VRIILIYFLISSLVGLGLYLRQNRGKRMGGPISGAKALWLYWTISVWFFLIPCLLYFWHWPIGIKYPLLFLSASMWIRGLIEIYMLFISRNWIPPYGIGHNLFTFLGMVVLLVFHLGSLRAASIISIIFVSAMMLSLLVETYYARTFFFLMKNKTKGDEGLWYAHENDPIFKRIVRLTKLWNIFFYGLTVYFLIQLR
jgi:hypothetical protein